MQHKIQDALRAGYTRKRGDGQERLEEALPAISQRYREVIGLRSYTQMSSREIARAMGLPNEDTADVLFRKP